VEKRKQWAWSGILLMSVGAFLTFYPWFQSEDDWDTYVSMYELQGACGGLGSLIVGSNDCSVSNRMYPMGVGAIVLGLIFGGISKSLTLNKEINESNSSKKLSMSELTGNLSEKEIFINFFEVVDNLLESIPDSEIGTKNMEAAEDIHRRIQEFMPNPSVKSKIDYFISIDRLFSSMPEEWIKLFSQSAEFDSYQKMGDWVRDTKSSDIL